MNPSLLRPTRQLAASFFSRGTYSPNTHHCTRLHISFSPTTSRKGRLQASAVNSRAGNVACFLHRLTASLDTSRAVACQGRLRMAESVLPLPQPSSSTRDPAGRSGMGVARLSTGGPSLCTLLPRPGGVPEEMGARTRSSRMGDNGCAVLRRGMTDFCE